MRPSESYLYFPSRFCPLLTCHMYLGTEFGWVVLMALFSFMLYSVYCVFLFSSWPFSLVMSRYFLGRPFGALCKQDDLTLFCFACSSYSIVRFSSRIWCKENSKRKENFRTGWSYLPWNVCLSSVSTIKVSIVYVFSWKIFITVLQNFF